MSNLYSQIPYFMPLLLAATACNGNGWANTYGMKADTPIVSPTIAHMSTQIRVKQLSTQVSQNRKLEAIRTWLTEHPDVDDAHFIEKIKDRLTQWMAKISSIDSYLDKIQEARNPAIKMKKNSVPKASLTLK